MTLLLYLSVAFSASAIFANFVLRLRKRRYQRELGYNPAQDCYSGIACRDAEIAPLECSKDGFVLAAIRPKAVSALLELDIQATARGHYVDPALALDAGDWHETCAVERGVRGSGCSTSPD